MSFVAFATAFVVIFVAELPDKTMLASMYLAANTRRLPVWVGATGAFALHATLASVAGGFLDASSPFLRLASLAFVTIGVAELGDFTQLTTATLSVRFEAPLEVGLGALLAESACAALGVIVGGIATGRATTGAWLTTKRFSKTC